MGLDHDENAPIEIQRKFSLKNPLSISAWGLNTSPFYRKWKDRRKRATGSALDKKFFSFDWVCKRLHLQRKVLPAFEKKRK